MTGKARRYDLEERTLAFAKQVRKFIRKCPRAQLTIDDCRQLIRSSGSIGANYIEANDSLSRKDCRMRIKICRKEAKETGYWLRLLEPGDERLDQERRLLLDERTQLMKIFGAILRNTRCNEKESP
jgi:four helix bundle protein